MPDYTAFSLAEIADHFDILASDQLGAIRWQKTQRGKLECSLRAEVWREAADMLRKTRIVEATSDGAA